MLQVIAKVYDTGMLNRRQKILLPAVMILLLIAAWLWWNRPRRVNLAEYAPAESLVFLETNDLPELLSGITSTTAWRELARAAGIDKPLGNLGWLGRLAAWTSIGPNELVIYGRAQVAVCVMGFEAAEEAGTAALNIKPKAALILETHSSERRARAFVDRFVDAFARRSFGAVQEASREESGVYFRTWGAPDGKRKIFAALTGSLIIVGNDEGAVRSCLLVSQNGQPALSGDPKLEEMRGRVSNPDTLSFGYVAPAGSQKILEVAVIAYAGQVSADPKMQSALAILLPQMAERFLGSAGWGARIVEGAIEDRYFLTVAGGLSERLQQSLATLPRPSNGAAQFLPQNTSQVTNYNYASPDQAWRGINSAISSQLDITLAPLVIRFLDESLRPFGIDSPREFLKAVGPELTTARLDSGGESLVFIAPVRDAGLARAQLLPRFGSRPQIIKIGSSEMFVAKDEEDSAASFLSNYLIMGAAADVRRCLEAYAAKTLVQNESFEWAVHSAFYAEASGVATLTDESESVEALLRPLARRGDRMQPRKSVTSLEAGWRKLPYSVSQTRLGEAGVERIKHSAFGLYGTIIKQFIRDANIEK
ncbi:MAG: hypothetical protein H0T45_13165 [Pyrinomonadaceae bacterium]|nr:hypothetical protein [Pyrinomonadaceae bacterium]